MAIPKELEYSKDHEEDKSEGKSSKDRCEILSYEAYAEFLKEEGKGANYEIY